MTSRCSTPPMPLWSSNQACSWYSYRKRDQEVARRKSQKKNKIRKMRRKRKLKRSLKTELVFCPYPTITSVSSRNSKRCSQKHLSHTEWPSNLPWNTSDQKTASSKTLTRPTWRPRTKSSKECQELKKSKLDKRCKAKVGEPYQLLERGQVAIIMSNLEVNNLANLRLTLWLIQELQLIPRLIWNWMPKEVFRPRETHSWRIGKEKPSLGLRFRRVVYELI